MNDDARAASLDAVARRRRATEEHRAWRAEVDRQTKTGDVEEGLDADGIRLLFAEQFPDAESVLQFYADEENWSSRVIEVAPSDGPNPGSVLMESGPANDHGAHARAFLARRVSGQVGDWEEIERDDS